MSSARKQESFRNASAVGRDGYVRVHPTWKATQIHLMDAGGFGRYVGWLLGAMVTALVLVLTNDDLAFWKLLIGIILGSAVGAVVGHTLARLVWGRFKREIDAQNPRGVAAEVVRPNTWMLTLNDGTNRAIRIESAAEPTADPEAAIHAEPVPYVRFLTSTGRHVVVPAAQEITIVDLAEPVDLPTIAAGS